MLSLAFKWTLAEEWITSAQRSRRPVGYRIWALLHYLDKPRSREDPERYCKLHHLNSYLRGNWVVTKELIEFAVERGWVAKDGEKTYCITESGRRVLPDFRRAFQEIYPEEISSFLDR